MKIRCDRAELSECLGDLLGIIPVTQVLKPIFTEFHLRTEDGRVVVQATDLEMGARIVLERVEVAEEGELAVPGSRFYSLLRDLSEKQVTLEALSGGRGLMLAWGDSNVVKILGQDPREFPEVAVAQEGQHVQVPRETFLEVIRRVGIAASRDQTRYQLMGVYFEIEGERLTLTATDGKRLTHDYLRIQNPHGITVRAIAPNRAVDVFGKVLAHGAPDFQLLIEEPNIHVQLDRGQVVAKVIEGIFPDYQVALSAPIKMRVAAKRQELLAATKMASLMMDKLTAAVTFSFTEESVSLRTESSEVGESRISIPIQLEGEPFETRLNPAYLMDALRAVSEEDLRIEFSDPRRPAVIRGGLHYRHLVMPVVIDDGGARA